LTTGWFTEGPDVGPLGLDGDAESEQPASGMAARHSNRMDGRENRKIMNGVMGRWALSEERLWQQGP
jgi:hypothetical protein